MLMKERIFFISPLPEDEDEEKTPYDKYGNTTVMAYYDEHGNTIDTDYQEPPEEETTIENRIIIIYEASKPKVLAQESQTPEAIPIFPTSEKIPETTTYPQPEENITGVPYPYAGLRERFTGDPYAGFREHFTGDPYANLIPMIYGGQASEQHRIEENQLASIRSELVTLTSTAQQGELPAAA
jgi:hypothetical protein